MLLRRAVPVLPDGNPRRAVKRPTASTYVTRATIKVGPRHRAQLVVRAHQSGLVTCAPVSPSAPSRVTAEAPVSR